MPSAFISCHAANVFIMHQLESKESESDMRGHTSQNPLFYCHTHSFPFHIHFHFHIHSPFTNIHFNCHAYILLSHTYISSLSHTLTFFFHIHFCSLTRIPSPFLHVFLVCMFFGIHYFRFKQL